MNEIVFSPSLWPIYHNLMRADFTLFDEYEYTHQGASLLLAECIIKVYNNECSHSTCPGTHSLEWAAVHLCFVLCTTLWSWSAGAEPFSFPITSFFGTSDRRIKEHMVRGWANFTSGAFECIAIEGHHLWPLVKDSKVLWLDAIVQRLQNLK